MVVSKQMFLKNLMYASFCVHGCGSEVFICRFDNEFLLFIF
jgi:hypothetical protein